MNRRTMLGASGSALAWISGLRFPRHALPQLRFGCASLTWNGNDQQAISDIASLGFRGIQLRTAAAERWGARPRELADLLAENHLTLVALSSGLVRLDPTFESPDLELHLKNARFLKDAGGLFLQVIDERPKGREPVADDFRRMGRLLTELGKRVTDLGLHLGYHNHMGALGQGPEEVARVLDSADPQFVKLELDTAHYQQAGGDPAAAVRQYADRLLFLHLKDLEGPLAGKGPDSYRFVELGAGRIDFPAVFAALEKAKFASWAIVELDEVTAPTRTAKDSALISKNYLVQRGFKL